MNRWPNTFRFTCNALLPVLAGLFICVAPTDGGSQIPGVLTNEELNVQKLFIEATQERLLGAHTRAIALYQQVLQADPLNDAALYELARVHHAEKEFGKALEFIIKSVRIAPDNPWYRVMQADILEAREDYPGAISVYESLVKSHPSEPYFHEHLIALLIKTDQRQRALEAMDVKEQYVGVLPQLIYAKVAQYNDLGSPESALPELEKLVLLYPGDPEHLHALAAQYLRAGREEKAVACYRDILAIDPHDSRAHLAMATRYKEEGDDLTYLRSIRELMANPAIALDAKVLELIPFVQRHTDDPTVPFAGELDGLTRQLTSDYPSDAKAHAIRADFLVGEGDLAGARQSYEKTLALDRSVFAVWEQLLHVKLEQGDYDGVLRTSEQALNYFPNQAKLYYLRGVAYAEKTDTPEAIASLDQALIMSARNISLQVDIYTVLGRVYLMSGMGPKADEAFEKAIKAAPQDSRLLTRIALIQYPYAPDKALENARKAASMSSGDPLTDYAFARIFLQKEDPGQARHHIEQAMSLGGSEDYRILECYGDVLITQSEPEKAVEYWQASLEAGNPSVTLKRKIAERRIIH